MSSVATTTVSSVLSHAALPAAPAYLSLLPSTCSSQEKNAFGFFLGQMVVKLPGVFQSEFWEKLVPQASLQESSVLHGVIALAAAQRRENKLALRAYNTAIGQLRRHMECQTPYAIRITLITCMVFICLELVRGSRVTAETHLQNGLQLLKELQCRTGHAGAPGSVPPVITLQPRLGSVDDCVVEAFTRFNVQSALFGHGSEYLYQLAGDSTHSHVCCRIPSRFTSLREARQHLDLLINASLSLSAQASRHQAGERGILESLHEKKNKIQSSLESWLCAVTSSAPSEFTDGDARTAIAVDVLHMYHTVVTIMTETCLREDETVYDLQVAKFALILTQVWELWQSASTELKMSRLQPELSFTMDMGFIPPLFYTAVKCREPNIRRIAIDLLRKTPHVEGAWDGMLATTIARRIMDEEEIGMYDVYFPDSADTHHYKHDGLSASLPVVPVSARFSNVAVTIHPQVRSKVTIIVERYENRYRNIDFMRKKIEFDTESIAA